MHRASQLHLMTQPATKAAFARMVARAMAGNRWCARSWSLIGHLRAVMLHIAAVVLVKGGRLPPFEGPGSPSHNRHRDLLLTPAGLANLWAIASPQKSLHLRAAHLEVLPAAGCNLAAQAAGGGPHLNHQAAELAKILGKPQRRL